MALPRDIWHLPQSFAEIFFYNWSLKTLKRSKIIGKKVVFLIFGFGKLWFWGKTNVFFIFCLRTKGPIFGTFWKLIFLWKLAIFMSNSGDDHCWYLSRPHQFWIVEVMSFPKHPNFLLLWFFKHGWQPNKDMYYFKWKKAYFRQFLRFFKMEILVNIMLKINAIRVF